VTLFAKIDCALPRDPKMIAAGPMPRLLYVHCVLYAKENLTDGYIDPFVLQLVAIDIPQPRRHMATLVKVGALEVRENGWAIPLDVWQRWNPTASEVTAKRDAKRLAGIRGNHERWHLAKGTSDPKCELCAIAESSQQRSHMGSQTDRTCDDLLRGRASPETETEPEPETETERPIVFISQSQRQLEATINAIARQLSKAAGNPSPTSAYLTKVKRGIDREAVARTLTSHPSLAERPDDAATFHIGSSYAGDNT
jgi:hypothetical protein